MDLSLYIDCVLKVFEKARNAQSGGDATLLLAGKKVRVEFAGSDTARLFMPALAHLPASDGEDYDFRICVWHSGSGLPRPPTPAWNDSRIMYPPELLRNSDCKVHLQFGPNRLSVIDLKNRTACYWIESSELCPWYEFMMPFKTILYWWLSAMEIQILHAAAVERDGRALILCGPSGSGKSTTALCCMMNGMRLLGDNYCAASCSAQPAVFSLYSVVRLREMPSSGQLLPLKPCAMPLTPGSFDKLAFSLYPSFAERLCSTATAQGLILPVITRGKSTRLETLDPKELVKSMFNCLSTQQAAVEEADFFRIIRLTKHLPCYKLLLGSVPKNTVETIESLIG